MFALLMLFAADVDYLPADSAQAYRVIRPTARDLAWQRVAWETELALAVKRAQEEKRPLLLWVAGDPPLERC